MQTSQESKNGVQALLNPKVFAIPILTAGVTAIRIGKANAL